MENKAAIFFDFNEPIITNTTTVRISDLVQTDSGVITSAKDAKSKSFALIFPNPMIQSANINLPSEISLPCQFSLISPAGRKVKEATLTNRNATIEKGHLAAGLYHYLISDGKVSYQGNVLIK